MTQSPRRPRIARREETGCGIMTVPPHRGVMGAILADLGGGRRNRQLRVHVPGTLYRRLSRLASVGEGRGDVPPCGRPVALGRQPPSLRCNPGGGLVRQPPPTVYRTSTLRQGGDLCLASPVIWMGSGRPVRRRSATRLSPSGGKRPSGPAQGAAGAGNPI